MFLDFHIDYPWVLLLLLAVLPAYAVLKYKIRKRNVVPYPPLQYKTGRNLPKWLYGIATALEVLLIITTFLSLAGPYRSFEVVSVEEEGIDVMLTIDISSSMQAQDFPPNRLEATKQIVSEFVRKSGGNRVGIVVFAK